MMKQSFDSGWEFTDSIGLYFNPNAKWQPVTLPHDISIQKPRSRENPTTGQGGYAWSGVVNYRKKFHAPLDWQGKTVQLEFEGVYMNAQVLINGNLAAFHPYGYSSFHANLTPYIKIGAENELLVTVNNSAQPNSRWYSGTGIYRHVWLRLGGAVRIQPWGVFVTTPVVETKQAKVSVATELANSSATPANVSVRATVKDASGRQVAQAVTAVEVLANSAATCHQTVSVADPRLWSVDTPTLYTLTSEVLAGGSVVDSELTTFGIRTIAVDAKNGFRLNNTPLKLKGGCVHHDNGLLGSASYDRAEERKIELMKAAGYNAIRCAHNPPAPAMLDACDRLGMLVIDETFDCWRMGKNPNDYHLYFEDWWQRDTATMVKRDRNHPSIIIWSIGNEVAERTGISDGYYWCKTQADFVRSLDSTRFVTSAVPFLFEEMLVDPESQPNPDEPFDFSPPAPTDPAKDRWGLVTREFNANLDVTGYNYLYNRYQFDSQVFPDRVVCGTETFPHKAYETWAATLSLPNVIGDFVWTSLDYLGESGIGKVHIDRPMTVFFGEDPWPFHIANCGDIDICGFKRPQSYYRDILWGVRKAPYIGVLDPQLYGKKITFNPWGWEPVVDSWTFPGQEGKLTQVDVYSADDEVELLVNGVSAGRKPAGAAAQNKATFVVTYAAGTIEAVAYRDGKETARHALKTAGAPAALRLTPDRATLKAAPGDLSYVTVEVVDANGAVVRCAGNEITFEVSGPGDLLAVGAANPLSEELYVGNKRKAFEGRLMAVVRSVGQGGEIMLKASADGLAGAEIRLSAI